MNNNDILLLKRQLLRKGYLSKAIGSVYDQTTSQAISRFQHHHQLPATGLCDELTWALVFAMPFPVQNLRYFASWFNQIFLPQNNFKHRLDEVNFYRIFGQNAPALIGRNFITLNEFIGHFCIIYNETGGKFAPLSEWGGSDEEESFKSDAYFFGTNNGKKKSYNQSPNRKAGDLLAQWKIISQEQDIDAWNSTTIYPDQQPESVKKAARNCDFYKFRGRGLNQVTWLTGYQRYVNPLLQNQQVQDLSNDELDRIFQRPEIYCGVFQAYTNDQTWTGKSIPSLITGDFSQYPRYVAGMGATKYHALFVQRCQTLKNAFLTAIKNKQTPNPYNPFAIYQILKKNDTGEQVFVLNQILGEMNLLDKTADNIFDDKTEKALFEFQQKNQLKSTKILDSASLQKLLEKYPRPAQPLPALRLGSKGQNVKLLNERLALLNLLNKKPDDIFDELSLVAVQAFQQNNALLPDGIVGRLTWKALFEFAVPYIYITEIR